MHHAFAGTLELAVALALPVGQAPLESTLFYLNSGPTSQVAATAIEARSDAGSIPSVKGQT